MLSIRFTYSRLFDLLLLPGALALSACTLPKVLGESPLDDTTSDTAGTTTDTAGTTSEPTTTDTGDPPPVCLAGGGEEPGGPLQWSLQGDDLPAFFTAVATNAADELVLAGTAVSPDTDRDVRVELRDAAGAAKWTRTYSGANGLEDQALDVAVADDGFIHVLLRETILSVTGDMMATSDARLVVLRYAPDGALVWRWEQEHAPVEEWSSYSPSGAIGVAGDTIRVLVWAHDEPTVVIDLDASGAAVAEVELAAPAGLSIDTHALAVDGSSYLAGDLEDPPGEHALWVGRFALDGSPVWSDQFGGLDDKPTTLVPGPEGDVLLAWSTSLPGGFENHLRRYDAAGGELWTEPMPLTGIDSGALSGVVRCDGVVLLTGGTGRPPAPDSQWGMRRELWLGAYGLDGTQLWLTDHEFGDVESFGEGNDLAVTLDGDAIVTGSFLADDGDSYLPWLGRFAGG